MKISGILPFNGAQTGLKSENLWQLPPDGCVKLNFDGSSKGNLGPAGGGCLVRDSQGQPIFMLTLDCGTLSNNLAEGMALLQSLRETSSFQWKRLWIEGDSKTIIDALSSCSSKAWILNQIIQEILQRLFGFEEFSLHLDHIELEQAGEKRGAEANFHAHAVLRALKALVAGHKAIAGHLGLEFPPEVIVNFPCEGTSSKLD
ncbi:hypothetical protein KI387_025720 [Taxus chinensis]|uniref:RNase H type-1 domain-containing protein n=1 Tax=Taxus chinensis TaxID=29808 RepID=A0AA38L7H6_TAXCH|nr:hypothetical protein KI387_025720 [Taxus chinensis]